MFAPHTQSPQAHASLTPSTAAVLPSVLVVSTSLVLLSPLAARFPLISITYRLFWISLSFIYSMVIYLAVSRCQPIPPFIRPLLYLLYFLQRMGQYPLLPLSAAALLSPL